MTGNKIARRFLYLGAFALGVLACQPETPDKDTPVGPDKPKTVSVTSVSLDKTELTLVQGTQFSLTATVSPKDATDQSVTWSSDNPSVATVTSSGEVSAVTPGAATITVKTTDGGHTATCKVLVEAATVSVTGVSLDKTELTLVQGTQFSLTATVSPKDATDQSVTWSSDNPSVATVTSSGEVSAVTPGAATITVKTTDGGHTATCKVLVEAATVSVTGVSLDRTSLTLTEGDSFVLTATVWPDNATDKSVTWSSNKISVATVSSSGKVVAVAPGIATITVATVDGGFEATCKVTVNAATVSVTGVSLNKTSLTLTEGDSYKLTATVFPDNATDPSVNWSSDNTPVAAVSSSGKVTAIAPGTATITVTTVDGGFKATCDVTVKATAVHVTGVSLDRTSLTLTEGDSFVLTATVWPDNATDKSVTWSSNKISVATVSSSGKVVAVAPGIATITVRTVDGNFEATCSIVVSPIYYPVTGISLNNTSIEMTIGQKFTLIATITPENATNKNVIWSSSNSETVSVNGGVLEALKPGRVTITVRSADSGQEAQCQVTVKGDGMDPDIGDWDTGEENSGDAE